MSLGPRSAFFSLSFFITASLHSIISHWLCSSSLLLYSIYCLFCFIFFPEWWPSWVHYMEGSHIITTIYPTDTGSEILSLRMSSCPREFCYFSTRERVYPSLISSLGLILFMFRVCIFMFEDHLIEYVCWWEFVCELSETLHALYSFLLYILRARWVTFS